MQNQHRNLLCMSHWVKRNHSPPRAVPRAVHRVLFSNRVDFHLRLFSEGQVGCKISQSHIKALHQEPTMQGPMAEYDTCRLHVLLSPGYHGFPHFCSSAAALSLGNRTGGTSRKEEIWPHDSGSPGAGLAGSASLPHVLSREWLCPWCSCMAHTAQLRAGHAPHRSWKCCGAGTGSPQTCFALQDARDTKVGLTTFVC